MNKENCALKLVDEIILYYDSRSKKHQIKEVGGRKALMPRLVSIAQTLDNSHTPNSRINSSD